MFCKRRKRTLQDDKDQAKHIITSVKKRSLDDYLLEVLAKKLKDDENVKNKLLEIIRRGY